MRKRHKTRYPGIYYRLVDEDKPDGPRRYIVWWEDANGDAHTETQTLGTTLEDARLRQSMLKTRRAQGDRLVPSKITVAELLDQWLELRKPSLEPATFEGYTSAVEVHLKKHLRNRRVSELSADDIAHMIATMQRQGMKTASIRKALVPLNGALPLAVRKGWIPSNPMLALLAHERPKSDQKKMRILAKDDIPRLLAAAPSDRWRTLFALLVFTGLRISEALALTWKDIDYTNSQILVRKSKTDAGERNVMLMPAVRHKLTALHLAQPPGTQFVFATASGGPVSRREALRTLKRTEKKAGLENFTLHELRHTFASILIGQGENVVFVSKQMGHADPGVTLKVYAHLFEEQASVDTATQRLEAAFGGMV